MVEISKNEAACYHAIGRLILVWSELNSTINHAWQENFRNYQRTPEAEIIPEKDLAPDRRFVRRVGKLHKSLLLIDKEKRYIERFSRAQFDILQIQKVRDDIAHEYCHIDSFSDVPTLKFLAFRKSNSKLERGSETLLEYRLTAEDIDALSAIAREACWWVRLLHTDLMYLYAMQDTSTVISEPYPDSKLLRLFPDRQFPWNLPHPTNPRGGRHT
jgi:hypothetical protein